MITIQILSNISRSEDNQAMEFGQLIECNMKKHVQNVVEKQVKDLFLKRQISLYEQSENSYSLFLLYIQVEDRQSVLKLRS